MRNERFFDQIEPPIPVSPQRAFSPVSYSPFPSQGPPQSRLSAKRDGFGERKSIRLAMSAPLALPESQDIDETDIPAPSELLRAAIPPRGRKRVFGMSAVMRYFMQPFRKNIDRATTDQMYELLDHRCGAGDENSFIDVFYNLTNTFFRPYFTYWATVVQILVLVVSVSVYGFAPVGFDVRQHSSLVGIKSIGDASSMICGLYRFWRQVLLSRQLITWSQKIFGLAPARWVSIRPLSLISKVDLASKKVFFSIFA